MTMQYVTSQTPSLPPNRDWDRKLAVVTAVHVARELYIEQMGNRYQTIGEVVSYISRWLTRNGAEAVVNNVHVSIHAANLVDAIWNLAELPDADPLQLVDDTWRGTSDEAHDTLQAQYERDLAAALNHITWKD